MLAANSISNTVEPALEKTGGCLCHLKTRRLFSLTLYPTYPYPDTGRVCDVVLLPPLAPGDRHQTTVGRVWIGTMDPQPLRPTTRPFTRTLDLGTAPREHRRASESPDSERCNCKSRSIELAVCGCVGSPSRIRRSKTRRGLRHLHFLAEKALILAWICI